MRRAGGWILAGLVLALAGSSPVALASHAELSGTVTVDGAPASANTTVTARLPDGTECGTFTTGEGGAYELTVSEDCALGSQLEFFLAASGEQAATVVPIEAGQQTANVAFEAQPTQPPVVEVPSEPLTGSDLWVVLGVVVGPAMLLLGLMVWRVARNGKPRERTRTQYRREIEGMVLVMVVVAVILLGVTDKIGSDGLVSVLAAIVGYTLGRDASREQQSPLPVAKPKNSDDGITGEEPEEPA